MKKLICFSSSGELLHGKRMVYQYTAGEQQEPMETTVDLKKKVESVADESKGMEKQEDVHNGVAGQIDKYIEGQKALLKKSRDKAKTDEEKKNFPSDEDFAKQLETAKKAALDKLDKAWTDANAARTKNADAMAKTAQMLLETRNKDTGDKGAFKYEHNYWSANEEGEIHKTLGKVNWATVPSVEYTYKGNNEKDRWSSGTFHDAVLEAVKIIYMEKGKDAAQDKVDEINKLSHQGFTGTSIGREELGKLFTVNGVNALTWAGQNEMYGDESGLDRSQAGKIMGLSYAALGAFGDDQAGKDALGRYTAYVKDAMKDADNDDKRKAAIDGLKPPTDWAMNVDKQPAALKDYKEAKGGGDAIGELVDTVKDSQAKNKLRGIWAGIQKTETDPGKQNQAFQDLMTKLGVDKAEDLAKVPPEKIDQVLKDSKSDVYGDALDKLDGIKGADELVTAFKSNLQGYLSGLEMSANGKQFKDGDFDYTDRIRSAYLDYIKTTTSSKTMDVASKLGPIVKKPDSMLDMMKWSTEMPGKFAALQLETCKGVQTPDEFFGDFMKKENAKYEFMDPKYKNQEKYVDSLMAKVPAEKTKERSYLRGILIAAVGRETDPEKMKALAEAAMKDENGLKLDPDKLGDIDYDKNLKKFVDDRKDLTDNGNKMDDMSKGLTVGLMYAAEQKFKDDPNKDKILASYKEYLKGKMDKLGADSDNSQAAEDLRGDLKELARKAKKGVHDTDLEDEIADLQKKLYNKSWNAMAWPDTFKKDFDSKEKDTHAEDMKGNAAFLDQYGAKEKTDNYAHANAQIDEIFKTIPKEKYDANKAAIEGKKKELHAAMINKDIKTPEARLGILAQAQDYVAHLTDDKASEKRFKEATDRYSVTTKILAASGDKKKAGDYSTAMAKGLGYETAADKMDPKVKDALAKIDAASDADRAGVMAEQFGLLFKDAPSATASDFTAFTKSDFDDYSAYIAGKTNTGGTAGGAPGGGAPSGGAGGKPSGKPNGGGSSGGSGGGAPSGKPSGSPSGAPNEKEKKLPATPDKLVASIKAVIESVLGGYKGKPMTKTADEMATVIRQALNSALGTELDKYDRSKIAKAYSYVDSESKVAVFGGPKDTVKIDVTGIDAAWVNKNMKEAGPEKSPVDQVHSAIRGSISSFISQKAKWSEIGINSVQDLNMKTSAEISTRLQGVDFSKVPDQVISDAGGNAKLTITGGKIGLIDILTWATVAFEHKEDGNETKDSVEKQVAGYLSRWSAELKRWTAGGWPGLKTGQAVREALSAHWTAGTQIPADLLTKIGKFPDIAAQYKPEQWFASSLTYFDGVNKKTTISAKYDKTGRLWFQNGPDEIVT